MLLIISMSCRGMPVSVPAHVSRVAVPMQLDSVIDTPLPAVKFRGVCMDFVTTQFC